MVGCETDECEGRTRTQSASAGGGSGNTDSPRNPPTSRTITSTCRPPNPSPEWPRWGVVGVGLAMGGRGWVGDAILGHGRYGRFTRKSIHVSL
jgi:hypothetical protein